MYLFTVRWATLHVEYSEYVILFLAGHTYVLGFAINKAIRIKNAHEKYQKGTDTKCRFVLIGLTFGAIVLLAVMSILAAYIPQLKNPVESVSKIGTILDFEYCKLSKV